MADRELSAVHAQGAWGLAGGGEGLVADRAALHPWFHCSPKLMQAHMPSALPYSRHRLI